MTNWKCRSFNAVVLLLGACMLTPNIVWAQVQPAKDQTGKVQPAKELATKDLPATAGAFAAYCTPFKKDCGGKIRTVQVAALAAAMWGPSPVPVCDVPKGIENGVADQAIVGWLSKHPEAAPMSTDDGIHAAIKGLWNCQESIATGVTSLGVPDKTGAFVKFCGDTKNFTKCANEIVANSLSAYVAADSKGKSVHCTSPDNVETEELTKKVLAWLNDHKEVYDQPTEDGNAAAIDHLWPCH